jgi:hypothetical protein
VSARNRVILSVYVSPLDAENAVHRLRMAAFWRMGVFNPGLEHQGSRFGAEKEVHRGNGRSLLCEQLVVNRVRR